MVLNTLFPFLNSIAMGLFKEIKQCREDKEKKSGRVKSSLLSET